VKNDLINENMKYKQLTPHNLYQKARAFLANIKSNPDIIIKKADKGSAVVIMNTTDYLREGYK
jgi:hypothetical protein